VGPDRRKIKLIGDFCRLFPMCPDALRSMTDIDVWSHGVAVGESGPVEIISPELVLVDPELRRRARLLLRDPGTPMRGGRGERVVPDLENAAPAKSALSAGVGTRAPESAELAAGADTGRRPRVLGRRLLTAALYVAVPAIAVSAVTYLGDLAAANSAPVSRTPEPAMTKDAPKTRSDRRALVRPAAGASVNESRPSAQGKTGRESRSPLAAGKFVFVWMPVDGATGYRFAFFRAGVRILDRVTEVPRVEVSASWRVRSKLYRIEPGTYRWTVRAITRSGTGAATGAPVVDSLWVLSPGR
jgi:hypothetical protein